MFCSGNQNPFNRTYQAARNPARLHASVPPEVNTTPSGAPPQIRPTRAACSTAARAYLRHARRKDCPAPGLRHSVLHVWADGRCGVIVQINAAHARSPTGRSANLRREFSGAETDCATPHPQASPHPGIRKCDAPARPINHASGTANFVTGTRPCSTGTASLQSARRRRG